ncbi:MAG: site-2 protease family protein [Helicobacteraceae bacterium]|nr:site-2 protease family protein [Helicobacteraceae bacterium]
MFDLPKVYEIGIMILALLVAIIGHEIMHGVAALKYGDTTARDSGRLSINPLVHIDLIGSILIPSLLIVFNAPFLFGWAKPVPVNINKVVRNGGYLGAFVVSLAGISYNLILALICSLLLFFVNLNFANELSLSQTASFALFVGIFFILQLIIYNVILAVFNILPIPPLDGSQALAYLGLMFKSPFFANLFSRIPPFAGMLVLIIILSTPLVSIVAVPAQTIINLFL